MGERRLSTTDSTRPAATRTLLQDPRVEALIVSTPTHVMVKHGLGFDACDVAVIDTAASTPADDITATAIVALERLIGLATRAVVIDIEHLLRAELTKRRAAADFILISMQPDCADLDAHISSGASAITVDPEADPPLLTLLSASRRQKNIPCPDLDAASDRKDRKTYLRTLAFVSAGMHALER